MALKFFRVISISGTLVSVMAVPSAFLVTEFFGDLVIPLLFYFFLTSWVIIPVTVLSSLGWAILEQERPQSKKVARTILIILIMSSSLLIVYLKLLHSFENLGGLFGF